MNGTKIIFDTCAAILLLDGKYELSSLGIVMNDSFPYISIITRMELMAKRNMRQDEEQAIRNFIDDVTVSPLSDEIESKTVEIRRTTKIKLPDCIIAATAIVLEAVLLTSDPHLLNLSVQGYNVKAVI